MVIALYRDDHTGNIRAFVNMDGSTLRVWPTVEAARLDLRLEDVPEGYTNFLINLGEEDAE